MIKILERDEAWDLFVKMAGDIVTQDPDIQPTAKDLVTTYVKFPPLVTSLIKALRNKHMSDWKQALHQLYDEIRDYRLNPTSEAELLMFEHLQKIFLVDTVRGFYMVTQE